MLTQEKENVRIWKYNPRALLRALIGWFVKLRHQADFGANR